MATIDASHSGNGRGSEAWYRPWTQFRADRRSPGYCRVTFDHPPANAITATTVAELAELVALMEDDADLNVVVFDSANPDIYLGSYDVEDDPSRAAAWLNVLGRLARAPVIGIASIRGHVGGAGSEFVLACDVALVVSDDQLDEEVEEIAFLLSRFDQELSRRQLGVGPV